MIKVTKINDEMVYINALLVEFVEKTPDTMITLTTGRKIVVKEPVDVVINSIIDYHLKINPSS